MAHDGGDGSSADDKRWERLVLCRTALSKSEEASFREVFPEIVETHHDAVWNQIRRKCFVVDDAEEILDDVFFTLFDHVVKTGFPDDVGAKLHVIAEHRLMNYVRDARRAPFSVGLPSSSSGVPGSTPDMERALDLRELSERVQRELSPDHLAVIHKVIFGELSHQDAAKALGIPEGTVKSRLLQAREALGRLAARIFPPSQRGNR